MTRQQSLWGRVIWSVYFKPRDLNIDQFDVFKRWYSKFAEGIQRPVLSRFQMIETCQIVSYKAMSQKLDLSVSGIWTVHLIIWHIRPFKNWSTKSPFFKCSAFRSPLWVLKTWNSDDIKEMFYTITFQPQCTTTLQEEVDSMKSGQSIVSGRI